MTHHEIPLADVRSDEQHQVQFDGMLVGHEIPRRLPSLINLTS